MPAYRGILLSVMSQWDSNQFPEFPHPDSPNFKSEAALDETSILSQLTFSNPVLSPSTVPSSKADRVLGRKPSISCYIPSLPGVQFFLKYAVQPPHPDGQYFYFKLFMNGRHITSWGVTPRTNPRGYITRALYEADEKWDVKAKRGRVFKHGGIEKRPFLFTEHGDGKSAAVGGGRIEVQVFRSRGRKRKAPILERFRPQEQYGIQLPSVGLVENPQDMKYFEWVLVDPKDSPYATFYFHYRSWDYLQSLQLIPHSHPRKLLPPSSSFAPIHTMPGKSPESEGRDGIEDDDEVSYFPDDLEPWATEAMAQRHPTTFDDGSNGKMHPGSRLEVDYATDILLPEDQDVLQQYRAPYTSFSVPESMNDLEYEQPLPELPVQKSSLDECDSSPDESRSRRSSASSGAISITPSLLRWLDRGSNNCSPEPFIGVATTVRILRAPAPVDGSLLDEHHSFFSADGHTDPSHHPMSRPKSPYRTTPPSAISLPPSVTVRKPRRPENFGQTRVRIVKSSEEGQLADSTHPFRATNFALSETSRPRGEQTFSPHKRNIGDESRSLLSSRDKGKMETIDQPWTEETTRAALINDRKNSQFFYSYTFPPRPSTPDFIEDAGPRIDNWI